MEETDWGSDTRAWCLFVDADEPERGFWAALRRWLRLPR